MTLVYDRRAELGAVPMCHAFLVGVSEYTHLPGPGEPPDDRSFSLKRLASPALSAWKICHWLIANQESLARPLGTVRILISPSAIEAEKLEPLPDLPGVAGGRPDPADWAHFVPEALAWRNDSARNRDSMTCFYYSGHGLEQFGSPLLTLADFTDPNAGGRLQRAFALNANFIGGMAPAGDRPNMARSQFYFIDACREPITDEAGLRAPAGSVWDSLSGLDDRGTPVFMATYPGAVAQAREGEPTDFALALLECFETGAENSDLEDPAERWPVSSFTLNNALARYFRNLRTGQYTAPTGVAFHDLTFRWLDQPPPVEFSLLIRPDPAIDCTTISVRRAGGGFEKEFEAARPDHPYKIKSRAGIFELSASGGQLYRERRAQEHINQRRPVWPVSMEDLTP